MGELILLDEHRIRKHIKRAEEALIQARMLVIMGEEVPDNLISRLEQIIVELEDKLVKLLEHGVIS